MKTFMTRVVMHDSYDERDYTKLYIAMELRSFAKTIQGSDGKVYHLPPGHYWKRGTFTKDQVLQSAKEAAATTQKACSIIVTEGESTWTGLKEVTGPTSSLAELFRRGN